jgi:hypothetical protein
MKKFIGYVVSWALYWLGDLVSKPMHYRYGYWLYPVYNRLMCWSVDVQDWAKVDGPWGECNG